VLIDRPGHAVKIILSNTPHRKAGFIEGFLESEISIKRSVDLTLVQGISVSDRMDQTIRQVTELGVSCIIPFESARSTVRLDESARKKKQTRWQKVAINAAEQSAQLMYPHIYEPVRIDGLLELLASYSLVLFFWEEATESLFSVMEQLSPGLTCLPGNNLQAEQQNLRLAVVVGPEGGFSQTEAEMFLQSGAYAVSLGQQLLRTETAAVVACALALYRFGALGGS